MGSSPEEGPFNCALVQSACGAAPWNEESDGRGLGVGLWDSELSDRWGVLWLHLVSSDASLQLRLWQRKGREETYQRDSLLPRAKDMDSSSKNVPPSH